MDPMPVSSVERPPPTRDAPVELEVRGQGDSPLVRAAAQVGRTAFSVAERTAVYVTKATAQYTAKHAANEQVIVSDVARNRLDSFVRGSATVSRISKNSLEFAGRHVEKAAELAATKVGERVRCM